MPKDNYLMTIVRLLHQILDYAHAMILKSLMCAHATLHNPTCRHFLLLPKHLTVAVPLPEMIEPGLFGCDQQSHSLTCAAFEWLSSPSSERMPPGTGGGAGKASLLIRPVKGLKKKCRPSRAVTFRHSGCSAEPDCSCSPISSVLCQVILWAEGKSMIADA